MNKIKNNFLERYDLVTYSKSLEYFKEFHIHNYQLVEAIEQEIKTLQNNSVDLSPNIYKYFSQKKQSRLQNCNSWIEFKKYIDYNQEIKQVRSNACNYPLLCPYCASRKD